MTSDLVSTVAEDLFSIPPRIGRSIRRKLLRTAPAGLHVGIAPGHVHIMKTLQDEGTLHVTGIGQKLLLPGPQMTHLLDGLVEQGMVERRTDPVDRRSINIILTDKGRDFLEEHDKVIMDGIRTALSSLDAEELEDLSVSLRRLSDTLSKLE
jgi:DNA-binding MarR family transcriptional regulator